MRTERPGQLAGLGAAVLIAITALFSLWFFGRKLPNRWWWRLRRCSGF
jgi:hypothetical protein